MWCIPEESVCKYISHWTATTLRNCHANWDQRAVCVRRRTQHYFIIVWNKYFTLHVFCFVFLMTTVHGFIMSSVLVSHCLPGCKALSWLYFRCSVPHAIRAKLVHRDPKILLVLLFFFFCLIQFGHSAVTFFLGRNCLVLVSNIIFLTFSSVELPSFITKMVN